MKCRLPSRADPCCDDGDGAQKPLVVLADLVGHESGSLGTSELAGSRQMSSKHCYAIVADVGTDSVDFVVAVDDGATPWSIWTGSQVADYRVGLDRHHSSDGVADDDSKTVDAADDDGAVVVVVVVAVVVVVVVVAAAAVVVVVVDGVGVGVGVGGVGVGEQGRMAYCCPSLFQ